MVMIKQEMLMGKQMVIFSKLLNIYMFQILHINQMTSKAVLKDYNSIGTCMYINTSQNFS